MDEDGLWLCLCVSSTLAYSFYMYMYVPYLWVPESWSRECARPPDTLRTPAPPSWSEEPYEGHPKTVESEGVDSQDRYTCACMHAHAHMINIYVVGGCYMHRHSYLQVVYYQNPKVLGSA